MVQETTKENQPSLDDLISLSEAAEISGFTSRHLRHLCSSQQLWAKKLGRSWFTTEKSIKDYLSLNIKPGRKVTK
ncbi:MAG: hypothetical protein HOA61_01890 [Bacteroidetes bacterium]|jgi:hypothetical protein|nr:hypothetical protein [Chloroflexota bacterium]MBT4535004.1 hypothetical protein [Chloroflexota bacterium]MBT6358520.1 hypothetical protein [Chloroflexota bacterium]MBT6834771.1 hypothetical protein [Bacteroidota bacterium]MBT7826484.1 hypothetical protein [Bacteroidota bacterium]